MKYTNNNNNRNITILKNSRMNHHCIHKESIYSKVNNNKRLQLLQLVQNDRKSLKEASKILDINYSTAKTILRVYRIENRILKKNSSMMIEENDISKEDSKQDKIIRKQSNQSTTEGSELSPIQKKTIAITDDNSYHSQVNILQSLINEWLKEFMYQETIAFNLNQQLYQLEYLINGYLRKDNQIQINHMNQEQH